MTNGTLLEFAHGLKVRVIGKTHDGLIIVQSTYGHTAHFTLEYLTTEGKIIVD